MKLIGAPTRVVMAEKIRTDRLKVWQETSPEVFAALEPILKLQKRAEWWITYKDKGLEVVCSHLLAGKLK